MNIDPLTTNTLPGRKVHQHRGMIEMPPRSELYCLAPLGMGTVEIESLTSYIQRLAWAYRVNPRVLVAEVILPHLSNTYYADLTRLGSFSRTRSMSINGVGEVAQDWARTLEHLTMRSDLRLLTLRPWADGLPVWGLLRKIPQWCPACYDEWQEQKQPVYQPLLSAIQAVTVCLRHAQPLVELCPDESQLLSASNGDYTGRKWLPGEKPEKLNKKRSLPLNQLSITKLGWPAKQELSFPQEYDPPALG